MADMFRLRCDTCEFEHAADDEAGAYSTARNHEATNPTHFVLIEREE
jgi:hypothetical protein